MIRSAVTLAVALAARCCCHGGDRPNVLFIAIDDLRSDLGCLGVSHAVTPNLDSLARSGRLFTSHYAQHPEVVRQLLAALEAPASVLRTISGRQP